MCILTSIMVSNAELIFVPSSMFVNRIKRNTLESGAPEKDQNFQNPPSSVPTPIHPKVIASGLY